MVHVPPPPLLCEVATHSCISTMDEEMHFSQDALTAENRADFFLAAFIALTF